MFSPGGGPSAVCQDIDLKWLFLPKGAEHIVSTTERGVQPAVKQLIAAGNKDKEDKAKESNSRLTKIAYNKYVTESIEEGNIIICKLMENDGLF